MTVTLSTPGKNIPLRLKVCPLREAFRNWLLFSTVPVAGLFLAIWIIFSHDFMPDSLAAIMMVLLAPEVMVIISMERYVRGFPQWPEVLQMVLVLAFFALRVCLVFVAGAFWLRWKNRAPYAETLWLWVACAFVTEWISPLPAAVHDPAGVFAAFLGATGVVVFMHQSR